jgi:hypothetical protein
LTSPRPPQPTNKLIAAGSFVGNITLAGRGVFSGVDADTDDPDYSGVVFSLDAKTGLADWAAVAVCKSGPGGIVSVAAVPGGGAVAVLGVCTGGVDLGGKSLDTPGDSVFFAAVLDAQGRATMLVPAGLAGLPADGSPLPGAISAGIVKRADGSESAAVFLVLERTAPPHRGRHAWVPAGAGCSPWPFATSVELSTLVAQLDPSTGTCQWVKPLNSPTAQDASSTDTGTGTVTGTGSRSRSGSVSSGDDQPGSVTAYGAAFTSLGGRLIVTGAFDGAVRIGSMALHSAGARDAFTAVVSGATGEVLGANRGGGFGDDLALATAVTQGTAAGDAEPSVLVLAAGSFQQQAMFHDFADAGGRRRDEILASLGEEDGFLAILDIGTGSGDTPSGSVDIFSLFT